MEELLWVIDEESKYESHSKDKYIEIDRRPSGAAGTAIGVKTPVLFPKDIFNNTSISNDEALRTNEFGKEHRIKILVVDDEEKYLNFVSHLLTDEGYEVNTAVDGIDALVKIKSNRYNLLLIGIYMPYINGFELYEYVKRIDPFLVNKTVVVSGSVDDDNTKAFVTENKLTCMAKPFDVEELKKIISYSLT